MNTSLIAFCCAATAALSLAPLPAHGGQYRGPGDIVPTGPGGHGGPGPIGPTTGGPIGPGQPNPSGSAGGANPAVTGGGNAPGGGDPRAPRTGPRRLEILDDLSTWDYWWEFNKDPYLRLKDAVDAGGPQTGSAEWYLGHGSREQARDTLRPTGNQIQSEVLPELWRALDRTPDRDITSSCLIALAKAGVDHPDFRLVDVFAPRLQRSDQEIRETAALAIGIAAIPGEAEVDLLVALAADDARGRKACGRQEVDERTRAFATYGLGVLAHATTKLDVKRRAFAALRPMIDDVERSGRHLKVAAIHAASLLHLDGADAGDQQLLAEVLQCLESFYRKDLGPTEQQFQAHCPPAIAKLLGRDHPRAGHYRALFAAELLAKDKKRSSHDLARSCALALGRLCRPVDGPDAPDAGYSEQLLAVFRDHKDVQTRNFAVLALGQIGGAANRDELLIGLRRAQPATEQPWFALALGVMAYADRERQRAGGHEAGVDRTIGSTLHDALRAAREPGLQSALAIGLGLCHYQEAADTLRALLLRSLGKESLAGYLCIGLALMDDRRSIADLRNIIDTAVRKPELFQQAAIALGRLGDKPAADLLTQRLADPEQNLARLAAIAGALGYIGDRRSIAPLLALLGDQHRSELARAFAAVALGGIADKEPLPWNSKIGVDTNYRAAVETLTNKVSGILDIL